MRLALCLAFAIEVLLCAPALSFTTLTGPSGSRTARAEDKRATQLSVSPQTTTRTTKAASSLGEKLFLPAFLPPYVARDTERYQVTDSIWTFEQAQTFVNVSVNIRMTVIQLKSGGLFVHAPVAPTKQCLTLLKELGDVEYIVLPVTAIEHKVYMRPFVAEFPKAKVYVAPGQFSWPLDLPLGFRCDGVLNNDFKAPFRDEIDFIGWYYKPFTGSISEVAFFHKASSTLLVTDAVIYIDDRPPDILASKGVNMPLWKKMALQACFLGPPNLDTFDVISKKLIVSPVIRVLVVSRAREEVKQWVQTVATWPFKRIIPAHFAAPLSAGPKDFLNAYSFLDAEEDGDKKKSKATAATVTSAKKPATGGVKPSSSSSSSPQLPAFQFPFFSLAPAAAKQEPLVFPEKDLSILNALNAFVSASGLAD